MAIRLQKFLAECGAGSRRSCEEFILAGRVAVNGDTATLGQSVDPSTDRVIFDGRPVLPDAKVYVVLNKPKGVITSVHDSAGRSTVLGLVHGVRARVFPIGRLDLEVAGTLLLTNDGELSHRLSDPRCEVEKVYLCWVEGLVTPATVHRLRGGVDLEDGRTAPVRAAILKHSHGATLLRIAVHENRRRLIKRMCAAVGHSPRDLHRVAFGGISSDDLRPGEWRYLNIEEIARLRRLNRATGAPAAAD